jgi:hypothetical protein
MIRTVGFAVDVLLACACASVARSKGRSTVLWGVLGFLFSIFTLIVIALLPRRSGLYR